MVIPTDIYAFFRDSSFMILAWFLMATSFFVWGRFLAKLIGINISGNKGIIAKIWLGWCWGIFFFAVYHLFLPINAFASSLFYFPGIIYFFIKFGKKIPSFVKSLGWLKTSVLFLIILAASFVSIQLPLNFDCGYYYLNSIRWANEYHIIKGLGNLHLRLGFNQLYFLYSASLNFHPFLNDYAFHGANGFLYVIFASGMILGGTFIDLLLLGLFFFIPMPYYWINNPSPDVASTIIQIIAFKYFIDAVYYKYKCKEKSDLISFAAIMSALMVSVKLSNVVFALGLGIVTLIFARSNPFDNIEKKKISRAFVFIGFFFCIWILRGYIQTGYLAFPSSFGKINFKWTVPERIAEYTRNCIVASARTCGQSFDINNPIMKDYKWFNFWYEWNFYKKEHFFGDDLGMNVFSAVMLIFFPMTVFSWGMGSLVFFVVSVFVFALWLIKVLCKKGLFYKTNILFYLLLFDAFSITFWFLVAPDFRFANAMFIILFVISLMMLKELFPKISINSGVKKAMMFYPLVIFVWCFYISFSMNEFAINGIIVLKKIPMKTFVTESGMKLLVPARGKQPWDSELPSTPEPEPGLSFITDKIEDGIYIK